MDKKQYDSRGYTRRQFITQTGLAGIGLTALGEAQNLLSTSGARTQPTQGLASSDEWERLRASFLKAPDSTKPMTRWWWFGGAITPEEITRELALMREAGIRGVELQPVYPLEVDDPKRGIRNIDYFSREFFDLLRHTAEETRRLGMQFDFTLGSGWPFGGPFIPVELAARKLRVLTQNFAGPGIFSWNLTPQILGDDNVVAVVAAPVLPSGQPDVTRAQVITNQLQPKIENNNRTGIGIERWEVPGGLWTIMVFLDSPTLMQVKRPSLGMEGYVIDHFSREATELFLDAAGTRVVNALKSVADPPFHSVFCDSLEVYGADWTTSFMKEFQRRRDYDLSPYLPVLSEDAGPLTPHLRYDYHLTLSDLIVENFFQPLADWSEKHGMKARIQAHGAFGDVMRAYGVADIPEGEDIFLGIYYSVNIKHRRLASSAGHIYQKPLISAETYTWLRMPLFTVSLEDMKAATDTMFLEGINHIVNSGYPSSPPQVGQPGWVFYATTVINHNNTWWRHYPYLARYIQRAQSLLTQGVAVNPVAVYIPLADIYSRFASGALNIDVEIENRLGREPLMELRRAGYDFDLMNDHALTALARVQDGKLSAGTGVYSAVVVPGAHFMPPESLGRLAEFARGGGFLIFVERLPEIAPGMQDQDSRTARLRSTLNELWGGRQPTPGRVETLGRGKVVLAPDHAAALAHLRAALAPDFSILEAGDGSEEARKVARENVGFLHRRVGPADLYFVSNVSDRLQDVRVQFAVGDKVPERWNPETGEIQDTMVFQPVDLPEGKGRSTEVQLHLEPFESCFIAFSASARAPLVTRTNWPGPLRIERTGNRVQVSGLLPANGEYFIARPNGKIHRFSMRTIPDSVPVKGPWQLQLGEGPRVTLTELRSWNELTDGKDYSGWATYTTTFEFAEPGRDVEWMLDLGRIHETAEVTLNGISLGAAWKGWRRLDCGKALKAGQNQLKVEVANLWINKVHSLPKPDLKPLAETFGIRWGRYGEVEPKTIPPSGLLGPVRLIPLKRWTVQLDHRV